MGQSLPEAEKERAKILPAVEEEKAREDFLRASRCRAKARSRCNEARCIGGGRVAGLRSVIRQVGIRIYRVVKSIGVSVSPCIL